MGYKYIKTYWKAIRPINHEAHEAHEDGKIRLT